MTCTMFTKVQSIVTWIHSLSKHVPLCTSRRLFSTFRMLLPVKCSRNSSLTSIKTLVVVCVIIGLLVFTVSNDRTVRQPDISGVERGGGSFAFGADSKSVKGRDHLVNISQAGLKLPLASPLAIQVNLSRYKQLDIGFHADLFHEIANLDVEKSFAVEGVSLTW